MLSNTVNGLLSLFGLDKHSQSKDEQNLTDPDNSIVSATSRRQLFLIFLKIGCLSFGGFMALIAVIENEIVKRRNLLNHQDLLDAIALANLLPGPQAVNVVAFVGHRLYGGIGALFSAVAVLLPSFFLVLIFSYFYFQYGHIEGLQKVFQGFLPAIAAIIFSVAWTMSKKVVTGKLEVFLVALAITMMIVAPGQYKIYTPISIVLLYGIVSFIYYSLKSTDTFNADNIKASIDIKHVIFPLIILLAILIFPYLPHPFHDNATALLTITLASMSLMLFGGGYVFIPMIGAVVVLQYGWLTQQEFADGIAVGQLTPGPILISATFIGYKISGWVGALVATIAIFTPPAILMVVMTHIYSFIVRSRITKSVMHIIHCGVIGMIIIAGFILLRMTNPEIQDLASINWISIAIFLVSLVALVKYKVNIVFLIPAAGAIAFILY